MVLNTLKRATVKERKYDSNDTNITVNVYF